MRPLRLAAVLLALALAEPVSAAEGAQGGAAPGPKALMTWPDLLGRPRPSADEILSYGSAPQQFGELWRPAATHAPVVVMIHGGCWTKSVADLHIMNWAADDLRRRGYAVWNIEYRGVDEPGGGYPGTFTDVAAALDALPAIAASRGLDSKRVVVIGHSAGGHLALWAAARPNIRPPSPLASRRPLRIAGVVDLAGIADLERDVGTRCGPEPVAQMAGRPGPDRADVYADTSPAAMLPIRTPAAVIHGASDETVRPEVGAAFAARAAAAGDRVRVSTPPGGHVEIITPGTEAWETAADEIWSLLVKTSAP